MADGKGCKCGAYGSCECGCPDVDWTPQEVYDLRARVKELESKPKRPVSEERLEKIIRHVYLEYIYTDKPHGLSDKDIAIIAKAILADLNEKEDL
jgi:hypothetical protein